MQTALKKRRTIRPAKDPILHRYNRMPSRSPTAPFHATLTKNEAEAQRWFAALRHQPRIPKEQLERRRSAFQQQTGRER